ncbi:hypothetical protein A3H16_02420 [Candidatus Kaiserbacteria bacterium RIFCSPLOWO2_12_FULL_53_8]|uniref:DUF5666 domain-containing protein n=2 Tax=Candidatus Kaiseribacteriota TaxID=1752734 RepID=A0A1F6CTH6_9BACT|nr:MAG: hypothetical protein A2851_05170 [Candidatus Kaiserbacteria bacterium RIFCSPHIGHO2_01_FULL_53_29]OGG91937.1 MAG: hypothetical protein A3H16_02420 [Candidatus Kaiserbacteria bacterium RIFCSPLOWO2_12_FULL_53_8]
MMPSYIFSQRIFTVAAVSVGALLLAGLFLYQVHAPPLARALSAGSAAITSSPGKAYLSAQAPVVAVSGEEAPMVEVNIANNGLVLLRGAHVLAMNGGTIHVGMSWGSSDLTWILETNYNTQFLTQNGKKETLSDIQVGDIVTVTGKISGGGTEPIIDTQVVRE